VDQLLDNVSGNLDKCEAMMVQKVIADNQKIIMENQKRIFELLSQN
jgi:hypothetical protein